MRELTKTLEGTLSALWDIQIRMDRQNRNPKDFDLVYNLARNAYGYLSPKVNALHELVGSTEDEE